MKPNAFPAADCRKNAIEVNTFDLYEMLRAAGSMMSARMLRAEDAASGHGDQGHGEARSRQGFYARLDRAYERMLRFTLAHRRTAALIALGIMLTSIPLFKLVKVEYIPSDVDESQFEVSVNAPEGTK